MTYARLGWQREFHDSLSNGQVASTSKPTVGAMNTPQSIPTQAFESHLTQVDPQVGITIHDSSGVCRAATASMSRILQIPLGKIRGATLGEICSLADPCLIEPDLLADVARIGSAVKSLRPHIPGSGPTPLELVAVKVTHEDEEATQIMWTPEAERIREVTLLGW